MPYFKDKSGKLHFLESTDDAHLLPEGCIQISDENAAAMAEPSIHQLKAERLAAINVERDRREEAGFPYQNKVIDSTPRSVQRITTAALAAQVALKAGEPLTIVWTCADNSTLSLDAKSVLGMPVALAQYAATLHAHARTLKAAVTAAIDQTELDSVDILAGWPAQ